MRMKPTLENADVVRMLAAAKAEAVKNGWPVSIAILDDGGAFLALERLDGAAAVSAENAIQKARTAVLFRRPSKLFQDHVKDQPELLSLKLQIIEGGVPIMLGGDCLGAVGVSGVMREQDEQVAKAALAALKA